MKTPIEIMLDGVEWVECPHDCQEPDAGDLPYATHSGVLKIGDMELCCYRLNTGEAIFDADDIHKHFGEMLDALKA